MSDIDLGTIQPGFRFPPDTIHLDVATIAAYAGAVEDASPLYAGEPAVAPPLAVLALAMRVLADLLSRRPGTLHTSQRLTAHRAVPIGSTVTAQLSVASRSVRRGFAALTLDVRIEVQQITYLDGSMLLFVPLTTE